MELVGLFKFDAGWRHRVEQVLPKLALRIATAQGMDPAIDGSFEIGSSRKCNAHALPGPRFRINEGAILALIDLAAALSLDATFAADRGVIPANTPPAPGPKVVERFFDYTREDRSAIYPDWGVKVPTSRVSVFSDVYLSGLSFLILHEQAHFLEGHLAYCEAKWGAVEWLEAVESGVQEGPDPITACALELDADATAISTYLYTAVLGGNATPLTRQWLRDHEENVMQYFVGAATAMALLSFVDRQLNPEMKKRRHPSPALRFIALAVCFDAFLRECGLDDEEIDDLFSRALHECRSSYRLLGVMDELASALLARAGQLAENHPLQRERGAVLHRLNELGAELNEAKRLIATKFSSSPH